MEKEAMPINFRSIETGNGEMRLGIQLNNSIGDGDGIGTCIYLSVKLAQYTIFNTISVLDDKWLGSEERSNLLADDWDVLTM